jgi:hypothetical protein
VNKFNIWAVLDFNSRNCSVMLSHLPTNIRVSKIYYLKDKRKSLSER